MQIQAEPLTQLTSRIFAASGCDDAEAHCIAHHLVDANLCGHDSHGVIRVGQYLGYVKANTLKPGQQITVTFENDCIAVVDGNLGFGQTIGEQAMVRRAGPSSVMALANSIWKYPSHSAPWSTTKRPVSY